MNIGILGAGQLGRMLAQAGLSLDGGHRFRFLDPSSEACAAEFGEVIAADYLDEAALSRFVAGLDVCTYEFENVPAGAVEWLSRRVPVLPPPPALRTAQDREAEKRCFTDCGIEVPPYRIVRAEHDVAGAVRAVGLPCIAKPCRFGYDGKGQRVLRTDADVTGLEVALRAHPAPHIIESLVRFDREVSIIAVRARAGSGQNGVRNVAFYPLTENVHEKGILRFSRAPARGISDRLRARALEAALRVLESLDYTGVLAIEFFQVGDSLLGNEMACRVHNTGHWTMDACVCGQFENHLRAITGMPPGDTAWRDPANPHAAMVNLIGRRVEPSAASQLAALPGVRLHWYGKQPRPGRKVGHVNIVAGDPAALEGLVEQVRAVVGEQG